MRVNAVVLVMIASSNRSGYMDKVLRCSAALLFKIVSSHLLLPKEMRRAVAIVQTINQEEIGSAATKAPAHTRRTNPIATIIPSKMMILRKKREYEDIREKYRSEVMKKYSERYHAKISPILPRIKYATIAIVGLNLPEARGLSFFPGWSLSFSLSW